MMMIAFITVTIRSLVRFIGGLCSSDSIWIQVVGFTFTSEAFALHFWKENMSKKKAFNPDLIPPPSIYIHWHVYIVQIYEYICAEI